MQSGNGGASQRDVYKHRNFLKRLIGAALRTDRPRHIGTIELAGIDAEVSIRRDVWGVPYINAASDADAWFGIGFCHGQDRAGQLEIMLRVVRGTLSELVGKDGVGIDRLARRIGWMHAGRAQFELSDKDVREQHEAYARGVNAGMTAGRKKRSLEHLLLGAQPTPWTGVDVQGLSSMLCFALAANWDIELLRWQVVQQEGADALAKLESRPLPWHEVAVPPGAAPRDTTPTLMADLRLFSDLFGLGGGSNAWAVSGARTKSGLPVLANDPHMLPAAPSQWYLVHARTPTWAAAGATFVGASCFACGHNDDAAWGVTAAHADHTDFFLERIGPDGASVARGDGFEACEIREERIVVKGKPDVVERVLVTPRGPIVGVAFEGAPEQLSISASWLAPRPYRGLYGCHKARTEDDFRAIFDSAPTVNVGLIFATTSGDIGYQLSVDAPIRGLGDGTLPMPGWDERSGWQGVVSPAELPRVVNPCDGVVAAANQAPAAGLERPHLGVDWLDGHRHTTIRRRLLERADWDIDATLALQVDTRTLAWPRVQAAFAAANPVDADATLGLELLAGWDGDLAPESVAASVYALTMAALTERFVTVTAPKTAAALLGGGSTELLPMHLLAIRWTSKLIDLLERQPPGALPNPWPDEVGAALATAVRGLRKRLGNKHERWLWGRARRNTLDHPMAAKRPLDRLFAVRTVWLGGDVTTIPQASVNPADPHGPPLGVATVRMVMDLADWDATRAVLLGGQSGDPTSPQAVDQIPLWERGDAIQMPFSEAAIAEVATSTLVLSPLS